MSKSTHLEPAPSASLHTGLETSKVTKFTCGSYGRYYQSDGYCAETKPTRQQRALDHSHRWHCISNELPA